MPTPQQIKIKRKGRKTNAMKPAIGIEQEIFKGASTDSLKANQDQSESMESRTETSIPKQADHNPNNKSASPEENGASSRPSGRAKSGAKKSKVNNSPFQPGDLRFFASVPPGIACTEERVKGYLIQSRGRANIFPCTICLGQGSPFDLGACVSFKSDDLVVAGGACGACVWMGKTEECIYFDAKTLDKSEKK